MPIIQCPDCGKDISDRAITCPHCGATKAKQSRPRRTSITKSSNKSVSSRNLLFVFGTTLLCIGLFFARDILSASQTTKPIVLQSYLDDSQSSLLNYKATIHALIKNEGKEGKVLVVFQISQNDKKYQKTDSLDLASGEQRDIEMTFEEARMIDGKIAYHVEVTAE